MENSRKPITQAEPRKMAMTNTSMNPYATRPSKPIFLSHWKKFAT